MKILNLFWCIVILTTMTCCNRYKKAEDALSLVHVQLVDRNGFNETISAQDRLQQYQHANFLEPQPYKKVVRVFKKNQEGKTASALTSYHDSGGIFQYLETVNGRAHGIYKEWYPSGKLKLEAKVIEGIGDLSMECINTWVFDGSASIYSESGNIEAEFFYEKGSLVNEGKIFYVDGKIKKITPYKRNLEHGKQVEYAPTGDVLCTTTYHEGKKQGPLEFFGFGKRPYFHEVYQDNLLMEGTYHDLDGQILSTVEQGCGVKSYFCDTGLFMQAQIQGGQEEGLIQEFFPESRQIKSEYTLQNGQKHGDETIFYCSNTPHQKTPKICITWQEGLMQGKVKTWYPNGQLESEREFHHNKKNGPSSAFYSSGQLMLLEEYENDLLTEGYYWKKGDLHEVSQIHQGNGVATLYDGEGIFLKKVPYKKGEPLDE